MSLSNVEKSWGKAEKSEPKKLMIGQIVLPLNPLENSQILYAHAKNLKHESLRKKNHKMSESTEFKSTLGLRKDKCQGTLALEPQRVLLGFFPWSPS